VIPSHTLRCSPSRVGVWEWISINPGETTSPAPVGETVDLLAADQVARLGGELFGRHLVAVEAVGVLLLVALIGAIAVVSHGLEGDQAERSSLQEGGRP